MMYVPLYLWAGLCAAMIVRESNRDIAPIALLWCAIVWPAIPVAILLDRFDGEDRRR